MNDRLLDTVTISELRKDPHRINSAVLDWAEKTKPNDYWLSVISILEIRTGILRVSNRDHAFAQKLEHWLEKTVLRQFKKHLLPVNIEIAEKASELRVKNGLSPYDSLIGATAIIHGLILSTRNVTDFENTEIQIENPWEVI